MSWLECKCERHYLGINRFHIAFTFLAWQIYATVQVLWKSVFIEEFHSTVPLIFVNWFQCWMTPTYHSTFLGGRSIFQERSFHIVEMYKLRKTDVSTLFPCHYFIKNYVNYKSHVVSLSNKFFYTEAVNFTSLNVVSFEKYTILHSSYCSCNVSYFWWH